MPSRVAILSGVRWSWPRAPAFWRELAPSSCSPSLEFSDHDDIAPGCPCTRCLVLPALGSALGTGARAAVDMGGNGLHHALSHRAGYDILTIPLARGC